MARSKMAWKIDKEGWHKPINLLYEYVAVDPSGEQLILDGSFSPEQLREILAYYEKIEKWKGLEGCRWNAYPSGSPRDKKIGWVNGVFVSPDAVPEEPHYKDGYCERCGSTIERGYRPENCVDTYVAY